MPAPGPNQTQPLDGEGFGLFLSLGLVNVRRNLGRSMLAVAGATLAAMIITSIIALSSGYPAMGFLSMRAFLGADVLVYNTPHLVKPGSLGGGPAAAGGAESSSWSFTTLPVDQYSDLQSFHPELFSHGFLSPCDDDFAPLDAAAVEEILGRSGYVKGVSPAFFLPGVRVEYDVPHESGVGMRTIALSRVVLRSRDFGFGEAVGDWPFDQLVVDGRVPAAGEEHAAVRLLDAMYAEFGYTLPEPGTRARLYVPRVAVDDEGRWTLDYVHPAKAEIEVIGRYATPTGVVGWNSADGTAMTEELFWITPQLQVPAGFFADLFSTVSGGEGPTHALQIGVAVSRFSEVENIAAAIQAMMPGVSVISVPRQAGTISKSEPAQIKHTL